LPQDVDPEGRNFTTDSKPSFSLVDIGPLHYLFDNHVYHPLAYLRKLAKQQKAASKLAERATKQYKEKYGLPKGFPPVSKLPPSLRPPPAGGWDYSAVEQASWG
jgi:hypothetical protein